MLQCWQIWSFSLRYWIVLKLRSQFFGAVYWLLKLGRATFCCWGDFSNSSAKTAASLHETDSNWLKWHLRPKQRVDVSVGCVCCNTSGMNCFDFCFCSRTNHFFQSTLNQMLSTVKCVVFFHQTFSLYKLWDAQVFIHSENQIKCNLSFICNASYSLRISNSVTLQAIFKLFVI